MSRPSDAASTIVLDDIDKSLIGLLQQDGRLPYTRLAAEVGLSEAGSSSQALRRSSP